MRCTPPPPPGFFCPIQNVTRIGCCNTSSFLTKRFYCETCHARGCCKRYENCVSCCLDPDKVNHSHRMFSILGILYMHCASLYHLLTDLCCLDSFFFVLLCRVLLYCRLVWCCIESYCTAILCGVAKCHQLMSLQQPLMISILSRATQNYNPLYSSLKDQFELCLTKCRTSSKARLS